MCKLIRNLVQPTSDARSGAFSFVWVKDGHEEKHNDDWGLMTHHNSWPQLPPDGLTNHSLKRWKCKQMEIKKYFILVSFHSTVESSLDKGLFNWICSLSFVPKLLKIKYFIPGDWNFCRLLCMSDYSPPGMTCNYF